MPKWIHDRAEHLLAKNPSMTKSQAFAIATQQAHALGKSPKDYGTPEGRAKAKRKYDTPGDDKKSANPGDLDSPKLATVQMPSLTFSSCVEEYIKIAASRLEKAIRAGEIARSDVTPGVPDLPGPLNAISRRMTRDVLVEPSNVENLERLRDIRGRLATHQLANAGAYVPGAKGTSNPLPGVFAGLSPDLKTIGVPEAGGTFVRSYASGPIGQIRSATAALHPSIAEKVLPKPEAVDASLRHAVVQHEIGEASGAAGKVVRPHSSHIGVEPILREQIALKGDADAVKVFDKLRKRDPEDKLVQKLIRQAGGTPDAPLPVGGRAQRAVERMLDRHVGKLSEKSKAKALLLREAGNEAPYVPKEVPGFSEAFQKLKDIGTAKGLRGKLTEAKDFLSKSRAISKFLKKANAERMASKTKVTALFDELSKIGAISDEQAERALERLESLERNKPTAGQVLRYAGLGAIATPLISAGADAISGKPILGGGGVKGVARGIAGRAFAGSLTSGAIPMVRSALDRRAEMGTLKSYLRQHGVDLKHHDSPKAGKLADPFEPAEKSASSNSVPSRESRDKERLKEKGSGSSGITPARPFDPSGYTVDLVKGAFATSEYSANLSYPTVPQRASPTEFRSPQLARAVQWQPQMIKTSGVPTTPAGLLASSKRVGAPRISAPPGPSIAQISKPVGFGKPAPGATKGPI